jgi:hypothetical protein
MHARRLCLALIALCGACSPRNDDPVTAQTADARRRQQAARPETASSHTVQPVPPLKPLPGTELGPSAQPSQPAQPPPSAAARGAGGKLYDVGALPPELQLRWPSPPRTAREVQVSSLAEFERAASKSATRVIVTRDLRGAPATVNASDVDVVVRPGVYVEVLSIGRGHKRVAVHGGRFGAIAMTLPADFWPTRVAKPEWSNEDIIIDGVEIDSQEIAIGIYGKRVAVVRSDISARTYSIWAEPIMGIRSEDILLAGNRFNSAGPEATVRLVSVVRSVTVDNTFENSLKHNYRIHGDSDLNYAARNVLINTGVMIGTMDDDQVGRAWFENNTFYHTAPDLFHPDQSRIKSLHVSDNVAYTNEWKCFVCGSWPEGWRNTGNRILPYRKAPERGARGSR